MLLTVWADVCAAVEADDGFISEHLLLVTLSMIGALLYFRY